MTKTKLAQKGQKKKALGLFATKGVVTNADIKKLKRVHFSKKFKNK